MSTTDNAQPISIDIMSRDPEVVKLIVNLDHNDLASLLVTAPPKADLLRSTGCLQWQYEKPARMEEVLRFAHNLWSPQVFPERQAVLLVMLASAQRRKMPRDYPSAEANLNKAEALLPKVAEVNGAAWAERIGGAIRNERCQILRPLGKYFAAAANYYEIMRDCEAKGDRAGAFTAEREWAKNLLDGTIMETAKPEMIEAIHGILETAMRRSLAFFDDKKNLAQVVCDRVRGEWLTNRQQDRSRSLAILGRSIEADESMRRGFGWSYSILYGANMLSPDRNPTTAELEGALRLAQATADDETMGPEWRPEAMLVTAQLLVGLDRPDEAILQLEKLEELEYVGPANTLGYKLLDELTRAQYTPTID